MRVTRNALAVSCFSAVASAKYVWPAKTDYIEDLWAMQDGIIRFGFTDLVVPCGFGSNEVGKQNSAEWIRTTFHDTITHNKAQGTGGLDASIMFETERSENEGTAFNNTLSELHSFVSPRSSGSDLIALGLVSSVAGCGGMKIPIRMGRIDATEAGPTGVPKPEQDLNSTIDAFINAGFNKQDMIAMVACGHSIGGVHSENFPNITGGEVSAANKPKFDSTPDSFDNAVVNEYFANEGSNPLVYGHNDTTNSDKRVFGADGNVTMSQLKDPQTFQKTCASIFERLIDTVPSTVTLSEPIELVDVKPYIDKLEIGANGSTLALEGKIRVRTTKSTGRDADALEVALNVLDREGKRTKVQASRMVGGGQSYGFFDEVFTFYRFSTEFNATAGLKAFDIQLKNGTAAEEIMDNEGTGGYPLNDQILYMGSKSCLDGQVRNNNLTITIQAAVRKDAVSSNAVPVVQMAQKISQPGAMLPRLSIEPSKMTLNTTGSAYDFYSVDVDVSSKEWSTTFDVEVETKDGLSSSEFHFTTQLNSC